MSAPFDIGLLVLCALVALQTLALKAILRETMWLARLHIRPEAPADAMEQALGATMPKFSMRVLDSEDFITDRDLRGHFTILLFITRADFLRGNEIEFSSMMAGLLTHAEECLYIVCEGDDTDAHWILDRGRLEIYGRCVRVLIDDNARFRSSLRITSTPSCVIFDEDGSLKRVGHPIAGGNARGVRHAV